MIITNLLTNMVVLSLLGGKLTNTPAFQQYARQAMLTNAQYIAAEWHLDPASFTTNKVTGFWDEPSTRGLTGSISFDHRYAFSYRGGRLVGFSDEIDSYQGSLLAESGRDGRLEGFSDRLEIDGPWPISPEVGKKRIKAALKRWVAATNQLSRTQALQVATAALEAIGLPPAALRAGKPPEVTQWHFDWKDERRLAPYYSVDWPTNYATPWGRLPWKGVSPARPAKARWITNSFSLVRVNVSGISGKMTHLENNTSFLWLPKLANYLELLGLPTNTIFVKRRVPWSEPPEYELYEP